MAMALAFNAVALPVYAQRVRQDPKPSRYAELVIDEKTGKVLYERNAEHPVYPASTTKLMTAYLTFQALKDGRLHLDDELKVSHLAASQPATNLWMMSEKVTRTVTHGKNGRRIVHTTKGEPTQNTFEIKAETALRGMLCHSANDAAVVFAEAVGGSEADFVKMMNAQAQRLGMTNTHFANPNGLPDVTNKTTVEDMAKLARALIEDFPEYYKYFSIRSITFNGHTAQNTNHLLGVDPDVDGMKTGWIQVSGFNLVASAKRDDTRIIGLVFGANSTSERNQDMEHLLRFAFQKETNPKASFAYGPAISGPVRYISATPQAQHAPPTPVVAATPTAPPPPNGATPPTVVVVPKPDSTPRPPA
jgi:D-alanyl-D-alanine carboxypeptidase